MEWGLRYRWSLFTTPPHGIHTPSSENLSLFMFLGWMLLFKEFIMAENIPHVTIMQHTTTLLCSLGVVSGVNLSWHSPSLGVLSGFNVLWHSPSLGILSGVNVLIVTQPKPWCSFWSQCVVTQPKPWCSFGCECTVLTEPKLRLDKSNYCNCTSLWRSKSIRRR